MRSFLALVLCGLMMTSANAQDDTSQDIPSAAKRLAAKIAERLAPIAPSSAVERYRVAVIRFNNNDRTYTVGMGDLGPMFQGMLSDELRSSLATGPAGGKFTIPPPDTVRQDIISGINKSLDPDGLNSETIGAARKLLKEYNYQIGIVGKFDLKTLPAHNPINIITNIITPEMSFQESVQVDPSDPNKVAVAPQPSPPSGRFSVEFFVKTRPTLPDELDRAWERLEVGRITAPELRNNLLLTIPEKYKGSRYKIVVKNNGEPRLLEGPSDKDRMFEVAVMVDGVSAFWRRVRDPLTDKVSYQPDIRHFSRLPKRVLTPPGTYILNAPDEKNGSSD